MVSQRLGAYHRLHQRNGTAAAQYADTIVYFYLPIPVEELRPMGEFTCGAWPELIQWVCDADG